mgnify:CR=1 FL=1
MSYQILIGDVIHKLKELPDNSIQTCITSPPYWGLRDYGTATWINGDANCDHLGKPMATRANINKNTGGFDVKNAERIFYTVPGGSIPNDQDAFAKWCYGHPATCHEDTMSCEKNIYEDLRYRNNYR